MLHMHIQATDNYHFCRHLVINLNGSDSMVSNSVGKGYFSSLNVGHYQAESDGEIVNSSGWQAPRLFIMERCTESYSLSTDRTAVCNRKCAARHKFGPCTVYRVIRRFLLLLHHDSYYRGYLSRSWLRSYLISSIDLIGLGDVGRTMNLNVGPSCHGGGDSKYSAEIALYLFNSDRAPPSNRDTVTLSCIYYLTFARLLKLPAKRRLVPLPNVFVTFSNSHDNFLTSTMSRYAPHGRSSNQPRASSSTICQKCLGLGKYLHSLAVGTTALTCQ